MMLRVASVSGWSGPSTRSRSGSSSRNRRSASAASPHSPVQYAMLVAGGQGVGVVGAEHPLQVGQQLPGQAQRLRRVPGTRPSRRRCCRGWSGCRGGRGRGPAPGRAAAPGTAAAPPPRPRTRPSRPRCCCGWSGCRGGRGRGPAPGRAAAPGTAAAPPPHPRTRPVQTAMLPRVVRVSGWSGPRTRSWSGSSSWNRRSASAASPHSPGPVRDVARGWSGCRGGQGRAPAPGRAAAPGTGAAPPPAVPHSPGPAARCCRGWSGCRGGRRLVDDGVAQVPAGRGEAHGGSRLGRRSRLPGHGVGADGHRQRPAATLQLSFQADDLQSGVGSRAADRVQHRSRGILIFG